MNEKQLQRRSLLKASLLTPLAAGLALTKSQAAEAASKELLLPPHIRDAITPIYGARAIRVLCTPNLYIDAPDIAENGAVVPITVNAQLSGVKSLAILAEKNTVPLVAQCRVFEDSSLPVALRIKISRSTDVYVIAETSYGLIGSVRMVKNTIGCGGG